MATFHLSLPSSNFHKNGSYSLLLPLSPFSLPPTACNNNDYFYYKQGIDKNKVPKKNHKMCTRFSDFVGGDLLKLDLGKWLSDVEEHKAIAIYPPHEGGYEGRYLNRLRYQGYWFLDLSARGLGDPKTTLTKIHPVCSEKMRVDAAQRYCKVNNE